jgi:hypothetical protein
MEMNDTIDARAIIRKAPLHKNNKIRRKLFWKIKHTNEIIITSMPPEKKRSIEGRTGSPAILLATPVPEELNREPQQEVIMSGSRPKKYRN